MTTHITITCDMKSDLHYAGLLNEHITCIEDAAADGDSTAEALARSAMEGVIADATDEWEYAARRIGAELGYEVEAITDDPTARSTVTYEGDPDQAAETVEQEIWQAAHDAVMVLR